MAQISWVTSASNPADSLHQVHQGSGFHCVIDRKICFGTSSEMGDLAVVGKMPMEPGIGMECSVCMLYGTTGSKDRRLMSIEKKKIHLSK